MSKIRIEFRPRGDGMFHEVHIDEHGGEEVIRLRGDVPGWAVPIDAEAAREERQQRRHDEAMEHYGRLARNDPDFEKTREAIIEQARLGNITAEEVEAIDSDHKTFNATYSTLRSAELRRAHEQRKEAIRERQLFGSVRERHDADSEMMAEHERYQREQEALRTGNFNTVEEGENE